MGGFHLPFQRCRRSPLLGEDHLPRLDECVDEAGWIAIITIVAREATRATGGLIAHPVAICISREEDREI